MRTMRWGCAWNATRHRLSALTAGCAMTDDHRMRAAPGNHEIELASGGYLDLLAPDPALITLGDIAHGLAHTCRYAGHTRTIYSVAEHAVLVARRLRVDGCPPATQLVGLHHDDAEAFVADIARPLKTLLQPAYGQITDRLDSAVWEALKLPHLGREDYGQFAWAAVKSADYWALACEAWHLMPSRGRGWWCEGRYDPDERPAPTTPSGLRPDAAARSWLSEHVQISAALGEQDD